MRNQTDVLYHQQKESSWFKNEAKILSSVAHECLPRVHDYFEERGSYFLVMDLIEGPSLKDKLEDKGTISPAEVLKWASQLLNALIYLHGQPRPIIHRDIKPDNIRLTNDTAFLVDFGLAKDMITGTLVHGHTPDYSSPEQARPGMPTDHQSDIYSFGATMYHLLTGVLPARSAERDLVLQNGQSDPLRLASEVNPQLSKALVDVINKALSFKPAERFQSAQAMLEALSDAQKPLEYASSARRRLKKKEYNAALVDFNKAIERDPNYAEAYFGRGQTYTKKGEYDAALADLNQAIKLNEKDARPYEWRAWVNWHQGNRKLAIGDYTKVIELEPTAFVFVNRGLIHFEELNYGAAIEDYTEAIRLNPVESHFRYRALAWKAVGRYFKAAIDFKAAIALGPKDANPFAWLEEQLKEFKYELLALRDYIIPLYPIAFGVLAMILLLKLFLPFRDAEVFVILLLLVIFLILILLGAIRMLLNRSDD